MNHAIPSQAQVNDVPQDLFPLPLSPFEQYMTQDDTDDYPMSFVLIVRVQGNLNQEILEESIAFALKRHPLLMSHVRRDHRQRWCWYPIESNASSTDGRAHAPSYRQPSEQRIDLTREIGLRVGIDHDASQAEITFQFHHACTDGLGGVQFIGDVLAFYGQKTVSQGDEPPELKPVEFDRLLARTDFSTEDAGTTPKSVRSPFMLARRLFKLLRRSPRPLVATRKSDSPEPRLEFPAIVSRVLDRSVVQQLKLVAARNAVELNDLYLLNMFQSIRLWNRMYGVVQSHDWFRIGMPTSLRTPRHDRMPAANIVSYMFLTRRASECDTPGELLANIHQQTSRIVNHRQGRFVAWGLKYVLKLPGLLKLLLRFNQCFTTVILANVGDIRRQFTATFPLKRGRCVAGDITLEALIGAAPVRRNTRLSTSLGTYAGDLYLNFHCDPLSFSNDKAEDFADLFINQLKELIPADVTEERSAA